MPTIVWAINTVIVGNARRISVGTVAPASIVRRPADLASQSRRISSVQRSPITEIVRPSSSFLR
jgi:hypothetical protein